MLLLETCQLSLILIGTFIYCSCKERYNSFILIDGVVYMEIVAKRLKGERENLKKSDSKWTQEYVADLIGVARPTYTAYENATKLPPIDTLNRIADVFDVDTDYLSGRSDIRKRPDTNMSFFGGPDNYTSDEIEEMEAALLRYREMKKRAAEQTQQK